MKDEGGGGWVEKKETEMEEGDEGKGRESRGEG